MSDFELWSIILNVGFLIGFFSVTKMLSDCHERNIELKKKLYE